MSDNKLADLTNCDQEPIHQPGAIQPHGILLVCDLAVRTILYASANAAGTIGCDAELTSGTLLDIAVGSQMAHELRNAAAKAIQPGTAGVILGLALPGSPERFNASVHFHEGRSFIEIEPCLPGDQNADSALDSIQHLVRLIDPISTMDALARSAARVIRSVLGYDRVMIYQFLHNGAGRVIAEAKAAHLTSYLKQHFPASDIPPQARRLYKSNTIRMIFDSQYAPISLLPALAPDEKPIDMSFCQLRSVSPIHCEYLQNMAVRASMSISLIVDGELWGLIACHHDRPKIVALPARINAKLFGKYLSMQIALIEQRMEAEAAKRARHGLKTIISSLDGYGSTLDGVSTQLRQFMALMPCDGVGLYSQNSWQTRGDTINSADALALTSCACRDRQEIWSTAELKTSATSVAGALAIPLSLSQLECLIFFRNEQAHQIEWAGNPEKQTIETASGLRLSPRGSFETWREDVRGQAMPWTETDHAVADEIRNSLRNNLMRQSEIAQEERVKGDRYRAILNDELNHRVKNIIALIKSIALQTGAHTNDVGEYSLALEGRLNALAYAHDQSLLAANSGTVSAIIEAEAALHRHGSSPSRILMRGPSITLKDQTFSAIALVMHELMTNAAKYGALSGPDGQIEVSWELTVSGDCRLMWREFGGPKVAPQNREGFGSKLIKNVIEYDLGGTSKVEFYPDGVVAHVLIPKHNVVKGEALQKAPDTVPLKEISLSGKRILVVEDQVLIAIDTERTLQALGASEVYLCPNIESAQNIIISKEIDAAILDLNLGSSDSLPLAAVLTAKNIPFIFATGYGDKIMIADCYRHVPVVRKPVTQFALAENLAQAIRLSTQKTSTL